MEQGELDRYDMLINEREPQIVVESEENSEMTTNSTKSMIFKFTLTLISIFLNFFDLITDFLTGIDLINDLGGIIIAFIFLPAAAAIILGLYQHTMKEFIKIRKGTAFSFEHTLLDINWFESDEDEESGENEANRSTKERIKKKLRYLRTVLSFIFRINSFSDYVKYLNKLRKKEKKGKLKDLEQQIRADEFLDAVFENLPQMCIQLYIFGLRSTVTHIQVISLFTSVVSLVFKITKISITRELIIRKEIRKIYLLTKKIRKMKLQRMFSLQPKTEENPQTSSSDINQENFPLLGKISKANDDVTLELSLLNKKTPSKKILINLEYTFDKENKDYFLSEKNIRCKEESIRIENNLFYVVRIFHISNEGFTFFIPTIPAVALFSSLYGRCFLFLYVPVAGHFIAEFWWWRIYAYKKRFTMAFHTVFLVFKCIERVFIIVLISVWFIKVIDYSKPRPPNSKCHLPSLIYPEPNRFLNTIANYELDGFTKNWAQDCDKINAHNMTIDFNRVLFSKILFCAIDPSTYILCIVFYINAVGFALDFAVFLAYLFFNMKFQDELGKFKEEDQRDVEDCDRLSIFDEQRLSPGEPSA